MRFADVDPSATYLISLYCSLAVLTPDALAVLDDVRIDRYHDYAALDAQVKNRFKS
ncbi:MAG: hypothetical protein U1E77_00280 [Inhella sp.]